MRLPPQARPARRARRRQPALTRCACLSRAIDAWMKAASTPCNSMPCSSSDSASTSGLPGGNSRSAVLRSACQRSAAAAMRPRMRRFSRFCATQSCTRGQCQSSASCATVTTALPSSASSVTNSRFSTKVSTSSRLLPVETIGPRRALAADRRLTVLADAHQRVQHLRQLGFDGVGQVLEDRLGALRERAFDSAELAIRGQRQHAVLGAALVELLEGELQQRQDLAVPGRRVAQHVVEPLAARRVLLEAQARRARRQTDHLADLARRSAASGRTVRRLPSARRASAGLRAADRSRCAACR